MDKLFWLIVGGSAGTIARFSLSAWIDGAFGHQFPYGTLCANILGSFAIGVFAGASEEGALAVFGEWTPAIRLLIVTGFLGALTTFSTYQYESLMLMKDGFWLRAMLNLAGSVLLGLLVIWLGYELGRWGGQFLKPAG